MLTKMPVITTSVIITPPSLKMILSQYVSAAMFWATIIQTIILLPAFLDSRLIERRPIAKQNIAIGMLVISIFPIMPLLIAPQTDCQVSQAMKTSIATPINLAMAHLSPSKKKQFPYQIRQIKKVR